MSSNNHQLCYIRGPNMGFFLKEKKLHKENILELLSDSSSKSCFGLRTRWDFIRIATEALIENSKECLHSFCRGSSAEFGITPLRSIKQQVMISHFPVSFVGEGSFLLRERVKMRLLVSFSITSNLCQV